MAKTLFFYDLETSGFNPRSARIMQFAGQRTDMELKPIGEPFNFLIKMTEDVLPEPEAVLLTGITPQRTVQDGVTEAEFLKNFEAKIATPDTIFVGYNTVRFDDEFMRFLHYRNFYDPYEWQWRDGRSRWDLIDVVRITRALRPEGIKWPIDDEGRPTNRLELITKLNKLNHAEAHDALSDVQATIDVARLLKTKQPKLFDFMLKMRDKKEIAKLVCTGQPFVYTSGKYPGEFEKTTVAVMLAEHPKKNGALVYDLRHDPQTFAKLSSEELAEAWKYRHPEENANDQPRLPIKTLQFNRCAAVAPLSVLDDASKNRLQLKLDSIKSHHQNLRQIKDWPAKIFEALEVLDTQQQGRSASRQPDVDSQLYDGFFDDSDRDKLKTIQRLSTEELQNSDATFRDKRLSKLLPLYKARNFPQTLNNEDREQWETYRSQKLLAGGSESRMAKYGERLAELAADESLSADQRYLLEELQLWAESIMPESIKA